MKRAWMIGGALALCACGEPDVEPASGKWAFVNGTVVKNTCDDSAEVSSGEFTIVNNGDGTFTVDPEDGSDAFLCTLDGEGFACPSRLQGSEVVSANATLEVKVSASGSFSSNTAASGRQDGTVSCTGSDCAALSVLTGVTLPCEISVSFTATFKG